MDCSSTFQIPPLRLISMTGIWRRQVTDIVVIVHFSPFLSFHTFSPFLSLFFFSSLSSSTLSLSPPHPHPHSHPHAPDHSPSEVRSCFPTASPPPFTPTLSPLLSTHPPTPTPH